MNADTNKPAPVAGPACTWRTPDRTGMRYPEQSELSGGETDCAPAPAVDERTADSDSVDLAAASNGSPGGASTRDTLCWRLQQQCSDWGTYWRASDAHGVNLDLEQALELLRTALGVEVEIAAPSPDTQLLGDALSALEYHQEQTRPIHSTQVAIDALRLALARQP